MSTGLAKTDRILLSTATVMLGSMADLHKLNTVDHSIGLVKNVSFSMDPSYIELGQGLSNDIIMSVKNADGLKFSFEVYEFTIRNLAYAAGLDGSGVAYDPINTVNVTKTAPTTTTFTADTDLTTNYAPGDYVFLQNGTSDAVHIAKLTTVAFATNTTTFTVATGFEIPATLALGIGARFGKVKKITVGGESFQPELGAKLVGLLPKTNQPITILLPKVKVTRGLAGSFSSDNFANMPFELTPYAGIPGEPFYSEYGAAKMAMFPR